MADDRDVSPAQGPRATFGAIPTETYQRIVGEPTYTQGRTRGAVAGGIVGGIVGAIAGELGVHALSPSNAETAAAALTEFQKSDAAVAAVADDMTQNGAPTNVEQVRSFLAALQNKLKATEPGRNR